MELSIAFQYTNSIMQLVLTAVAVFFLIKIEATKKNVIIVALSIIYFILVAILGIYLISYNKFIKIFIIVITLPCSLIHSSLSSFGFKKAFFLCTTQVLLVFQFTVIFPQMLFRLFNNNFAVYYICVLLLFGIEFTVFLKYRKRFYEFMAQADAEWRLMTALSISFSILLLMTIFITGANAFSVSWLTLWLCSFELFIFALVCFVFIKNYLKNKKISEQQFKNKVLEIELEALKKQTKNMQMTQNQIAIYKHDAKHKLSILSALIAQNKIIKASEFIKYHYEIIDQIGDFFYCENIVVNSVLNYYISLAQEKEIDINCVCVVGELKEINEDALAIMLANLFENAINANLKIANKKDRFIKFLCKDTTNFILEMSNAIGEKVEFDKNGNPVSYREGHGIGMQSVISFVKKYDAEIEYFIKNDVFTFRLVK